MASRGFGVAGALDLDIVRQLASAAEASGYASFWVNDTPKGDGLAALAAAATATTSITLAVGVIPVDRQPAEQIAEHARHLRLPLDRVKIGIGSGATRRGGLTLVRSAIDALVDDPGTPVLVGALGPKMCQLAAERADGALLNWLTPSKAEETYASIANVAASLGRLAPYVAGYVRTALGEAALGKLGEEAARYERIPQYGRHFASMGVSAVETSVTGNDRYTIHSKLQPFDEVLDETVVRAITAEESLDQYLALLCAAAP